MRVKRGDQADDVHSDSRGGWDGERERERELKGAGL